jgi:AcrR family transcriptional regulator
MPTKVRRQGVTSRPQSLSGRDRVLSAAYTLFVRRGVRQVGVDEIIAAAGVAKATLYRHFESKDTLIVAFLKLREELWTRGLIEAESLKRGTSARDRLLAIFDVLDEWFQAEDFEGCPFIGTVAQAVDPEDRVRLEAVAQLAIVRDFVRALATQAGIEDADALAHTWQLLMQGSIVKALSGDRKAARRARRLGEVILETHATAS